MDPGISRGKSSTSKYHTRLKRLEVAFSHIIPFCLLQPRPADFTSFCVVDFAGDRKHELVLGALKACERHGLQNDQYKNDYQTVTEEVTCSVRLDRNRDIVNQVRRVHFAQVVCRARSSLTLTVTYRNRCKMVLLEQFKRRKVSLFLRVRPLTLSFVCCGC